MTAHSNLDRTINFLAACGKEPGNPAHIAVQTGVHIEEFVEFLRTATFVTHDGLTVPVAQECAIYLEGVAAVLKSGNGRVEFYDRAATLDALCDMEVTGNGLAWLTQMDKAGADQAVLDANDDKLVDGQAILLPGGKIGKPAGWKAADLASFV
jgi:predicted HAD superfamily Cof-like phosphohydrolase